MTNAATETKIWQANLHKHRERTHGTLNDTDMKDYMMLMIQEPYYCEYEPWTGFPSHQSWTLYEPTLKDLTGRPPRAATYVNKSQILPAQITPINIPSSDVVAIQIHRQGFKPLTVINVYNPCDAGISVQLHEALRLRQIHEDEIILAGDFNCHHPMWNPLNYLRHDLEADHLVDLAMDLGLSLLIPPGTVTYPRAQTAIDLVWGNAAIESRLLKCQIAEENDQGSDHLPIETVLRSTSLETTSTEPQLNISKTDWDKFQTSLQERMQKIEQTCPMLRPQELDDAISRLTGVIQKALKESTPIKRPCPHSKRWWNDNLTKLRRTANPMRNQYVDLGNGADRLPRDTR